MGLTSHIVILQFSLKHAFGLCVTKITCIVPLQDKTKVELVDTHLCYLRLKNEHMENKMLNYAYLAVSEEDSS